MSDELIPVIVEEPAEKKRTRRVKEALIVIEHGTEGPLLYERLEEAAGKLARNGELIVSVPRALDGESLTAWLRSHGFDRKLLSLG